MNHCSTPGCRRRTSYGMKMCMDCFNAARWKCYVECSLFTVSRSARLHYNYLNRRDGKPKQWRRRASVEVRG